MQNTEHTWAEEKAENFRVPSSPHHSHNLRVWHQSWVHLQSKYAQIWNFQVVYITWIFRYSQFIRSHCSKGHRIKSLKGLLCEDLRTSYYLLMLHVWNSIQEFLYIDFFLNLFNKKTYANSQSEREAVFKSWVASSKSHYRD